MRTRIVGPLLLLATTAPIAGAGNAENIAFHLQPSSRVRVEGTSTVRSFQCSAEQVNAVVMAASTGAAAAVVGGDKAVREVSVRIPARALDCGNGTMNGHMYKALNADAHPTISFQLASYELAPRGESAAVKMHGTLELGGVEKPIVVEGEARAAGTELRVTGAKTLKLSEFGLRAPTLMLGTLKVGDQVNVRFDLTLKP